MWAIDKNNDCYNAWFNDDDDDDRDDGNDGNDDGDDDVYDDGVYLKAVNINLRANLQIIKAVNSKYL